MKARKKRSYVAKLLIGMGIYAAIFVGLVTFGLTKFWDYIDAYEHSQAQNTIHSYISQLDAAHIQDSAREFIDSIDSNVQNEDAYQQAIAEAISGGVSYARKLSECTDEKMVYMLMSGGKTIGKVVLTAQGKDTYGFTPWQVTEDSFDFSFLLGEGKSVTVPQDYQVYANGTLLSEDYITKSDIPFALLKEFYGDYALPHLVTYEVGPILGDIEITIKDPAGNSITQEEALDEAKVLNNCTEEEIANLDAFTTNFLDSYSRFSTNSDQALQENYQELMTYIVPDSTLADRLTEALSAVRYLKNRTTTLASTTTHHRIRFADGLYMCDITFTADVISYGKYMPTTESARLILRQTEKGLKVEKMINY